MANPASVANLGSEFDAFLFAPIGEEKNGMLLSVVSALARLNIDPWQEAANLATLAGGDCNAETDFIDRSTPRCSAAAARTGADSRTPDCAPASGDSLHCQAIAAAARRHRGEQIPGPRLAILFAIMLGSQWIAASLQPPAPAANVQAPTSGVTPASKPSPPSVH